MPYIITTHPAEDPSFATRAEQILAEGLSNRAVATLEEAQEAAHDAVRETTTGGMDRG